MSCSLKVRKIRYYCSLNQTGHLISSFQKIICKEFHFQSKISKLSSRFMILFNIFSSLYFGLFSFLQIATTQYWTCDGPNRQLHVGKYADQRCWQRTVDSGRMDPVDIELQRPSNYCDLMFSCRAVNNTNGEISRNDVYCVVSFWLECFTVLWTG